ncbi:MAG: sulfurtransferase complex subunit TusB [Xanthomonadales bacterium]|nr:sulfurtransferase complex subunit TusB [Xanthomonadales bacterium]
MTTMLHLVNKSPGERNSLDSCLRLAKAGSAVLLLEDGVYAAMANATSAEAVTACMGKLIFYVLGPDVSARGLDDVPLLDGINVVDYGGFVDLVVEHDTAQSWL